MDDYAEGKRQAEREAFELKNINDLLDGIIFSEN